MPKIDSKKFVDFYNFWKWEYTKRNMQYKKYIKAIFSGNIPVGLEDSKSYNTWGKVVSCGNYVLRIYSIEEIRKRFSEDEWPEISCDKLGCELLASWPRPEDGMRSIGSSFDEPELFNVIELNLYVSADDILKNLLSDCLIYKHPIIAEDHMRFSSEKLVYYLQFNSIRWLESEFFHIMPGTWMREMHNGKCMLPWRILIPDDDSLLKNDKGYIEYDEVYLGISDEWRSDREEVELIGGEQLLLVDMDKGIEEIVSEIRKCYNAYHGMPDYQNQERIIRSEGAISRFPRDLPRAVGLWLWDYIEDRAISWENKARACEPFREKYQSPGSTIEEKYRKPGQLESLMDRTRECIERMEVLTMA